MSNLSTYLFVCNKKCSCVTLSSLQAIYSLVNFSLVCFVRTDKNITFVFDKCLKCISKDDLG